MKCIEHLTSEVLRGKYVLVRAGLDVPLNTKGEVSDMFRVRQSTLTLKFLSEAGARVIVLSHIGRDREETNEPVFRALKTHLEKIYFVPDLLGAPATSARNTMRDGDILLLENLRRDPREVTNDEHFAQELASLGDIYVNDAFSNSHRSHASMVSLPRLLPSYGGMLLCKEVEQLSAARTPQSPSFAILGGSKFETKEPLVSALLQSYDHLFITGALANDVLKARGLEVGLSRISEELPTAEVLANPRFIAPIDVTVQTPDKQARVKKIEEVAPNEKIVDIGPDTIAHIAPLVSAAKCILWNGPTGIYEEGFTAWSHSLTELIADNKDAQKVIGGGDTIAAVLESGVAQEKLGFLSTGGGAMLAYLLDGTLSAIEVLG